MARAADSKPEPKIECINASERGQNERDEGTYRAARESFMACARPTCPRVVLDSCSQWLRELDESAPTIVLGAKDDHGNDLTDVRVLFDGNPFSRLLDGKPLVADTGEHVLRFERDGSAPVEQRLVVRAGERARVITVTMAALVPVAPILAVTPPPGNDSVPEATQPSLLHSPRFITAGSLAMGAVAAAGMSIAFYAISRSNKSDADALLSSNSPSYCYLAPQSSTCPTLQSKRDAQVQNDNIATGMIITASALAASALTAWFFWPDSPHAAATSTAWVAPIMGGATIGVTGKFE
jgi:hypothetical protein